MTFLTIGGSVFDYDLNLLEQLLKVVDEEIAKVDADFDSDPDPDGSGLLQCGDGLYGLGFVACQQYLNVTYKDLAFPTDRQKSIQGGPKFSATLSYAQVVDAAANFWKHNGEWDGSDRREKKTRNVLEAVFPSGKDYLMANLLHELLGKPKVTRLCDVVPWLAKWRDELTPAEPHW
jgi:hypothetical protein